MPLRPATIDGLDRIWFHHFCEHDLGQLRLRLSSLAIRQGEPGFVDVQSCVVTPGKLHRSRVSGVYDHENRLVDGSALARGRRGRPGSRARREDLEGAILDERSAYYLGRGTTHFGHFLLETFCRAWAWEVYGGDRVPIVQNELPRFALSLYQLISENLAKRIEVPSVSTRFAAVLVPRPGFVLKREAYTEYKKLCARIGERAGGEGRNKRSGQPVYLSRSGLDPDRRRTLVGEAQLEQLLQSEGFLVVRPETLPIAEQIALFNQHEWIVAPMGSACHTRLFAARPTNLIMLCKSDFTANFVLCDLLSEGMAHYLNVLTGEGTGYAAPLVLHQELLLSCLKLFGLVRPKAAFNPATTDSRGREEVP
jgi:capsular polysaccharide biosynthesis protein